MNEGRLIRDENGSLFRIPYGKADCESFAVQWAASDGTWRTMVFPGLIRRTDTVVSRPAQRVARA